MRWIERRRSFLEFVGAYEGEGALDGMNSVLLQSRVGCVDGSRKTRDESDDFTSLKTL